MERPALSDVLKEAFRERGLSIAAAAREADVPYDSLKGWLRDGRFAKADIASIARVAGLPSEIDILEREFAVDWTRGRSTARTRTRDQRDARDGLSIELANSEIDGRLPKLRRMIKENLAKEIQPQFEALTQDDIYVHCSFDRQPEESRAAHLEELGAQLGRAVTRGATLIYLVPSPTALKRAASEGLYPIPGVDSLTVAVERLKREVRKSLANDLPLDDRIRLIACDSSPFFVPGHRYAIFRYRNPRRSTTGTRCFGFFPMGDDEKELEFHAPMGADFTHSFWSFCEHLLEARSSAA